jgi:hypothetical protein
MLVHSKVRLWMQDQVSRVLFRLLEEKKNQVYQTLLNTTDNNSLINLREKLKIYHELLDIETLFEGELDEVDK